MLNHISIPLNKEEEVIKIRFLTKEIAQKVVIKIWRCTKCETLNTETVCMVCQEEKPEHAPARSLSSSPEINFEAHESPAYGELPSEASSKTRGWLIVFSIVIIGFILLAYYCDSTYSKAHESFYREDYLAAKEMFSQVRWYKDSHELLKECDYKGAVYMKDTGDLINAFGTFKNLESYKDSETKLEETQNLIYESAINSYRTGNYDEAKELFAYSSGIKETDKYLTLIDIRQGQITGGKELLDLISFEDTKELIVENNYYLQQFLGSNIGWYPNGSTWSNSSGQYIKFYIKDGEYGWSQFDGIPYPSGNYDHYGIEDGIHYRYGKDADREKRTAHWKYTIISQNQIRIYNYYDGKNYTFTRQ